MLQEDLSRLIAEQIEGLPIPEADPEPVKKVQEPPNKNQEHE